MLNSYLNQHTDYELDELLEIKDQVKSKLHSELSELKPVLSKIASNPMSAISMLSSGAETLAPAANQVITLLDTLERITESISIELGRMNDELNGLIKRIERLEKSQAKT
ncbi:hypothetical protein AAOGI_06500 [Agarivorans albus]